MKSGIIIRETWQITAPNPAKRLRSVFVKRVRIVKPKNTAKVNAAAIRIVSGRWYIQIEASIYDENDVKPNKQM